MSFTDIQRRRLSSKLSEKHVKTRQADGITLSYIEGWHAIAEANRIFGYDAWDRVTRSTQCVWNRTSQGKHCCVYTAKVRISVRAGDAVVVREGNGTGEGIGVSVGAAHDVAIKAAETDATKRALSTFGNPFGLALYDKEQAGVRRRRRRCARAAEADQQERCVFRSADGNPKQSGCSPKTFFTELRAGLANARSLEELEAVWAHNCGDLDRLRKEAPDLTDKSGQHYADVLLDYCDVRVRELQPPDTPPDASKAYRVAMNGHSGGGGKIDKAALALPEPKRVRNKGHLKFVASQACLICERRPAQAHHVRFAQPSALARKVSDEFAVPLCRTHHQQVHETGNEQDWWQKQKTDPLQEAGRLWKVSVGGGE